MPPLPPPSSSKPSPAAPRTRAQTVSPSSSSFLPASATSARSSPYPAPPHHPTSGRSSGTASMSAASRVAALVTKKSYQGLNWKDNNNNNNSNSKGKGKASASSGGGVDGKRRSVYCDVVFDGLGCDDAGNFTSPQVIQHFIEKLGTRIEPAPHSGKPRNVRPATPSKPRRVDAGEVRGALMEMAKTEKSYCRKITSLFADYADPLQRMAKSAATAIIPPFEARHLFCNLEELVHISQPFSADLDQIVEALEADGEVLPDFGEMILRNVEIMGPFRKWLSSVGETERMYARLIKTNPAFVEYIERQQSSSRGSAASGGFKEYLAEPFQRISRYSLMIDPIIRHLADDDPNLPYLEAASELLVDICSMEEDEQISKAASMWGLKEAIENFPHSMISYSRSFISCLDVDEIVESTSSSSATTLRCTLFLFSDKLVIAKRPVGERTGRQLAGLDNIENLMILYSSSGAQLASGANARSSVYTLPGSPKKLKRGVMGFRGEMDLTSVLAIDLGGVEMGLVMDQPLDDLASERWRGRRVRKYVVASTYPADIRRAEKTVFLGTVATTKCLFKAKKGYVVVKGNSINDDNGDSTRIYWSICVRQSWENGEVKLRGPLVLHIDAKGDSEQLSFGSRGDPSVVARANLLQEDRCLFSVRSLDRSGDVDTETIDVDRIMPAISEICTTYNLFTFPSATSSSNHHHHLSSPLVTRTSTSRPRSLLLSAAYDVFNSGGSLRRGHSNASKGSITTNATSTATSLFSRSSNSNSIRPTTTSTDVGQLMMAGGDDDEEEMIRGRVREEEDETAPLAWESNVPEQSLDRVHRASTSALRGVRMQYEEGAGESGSHQTAPLNWRQSSLPPAASSRHNSSSPTTSYANNSRRNPSRAISIYDDAANDNDASDIHLPSSAPRSIPTRPTSAAGQRGMVGPRALPREPLRPISPIAFSSLNKRRFEVSDVDLDPAIDRDYRESEELDRSPAKKKPLVELGVRDRLESPPSSRRRGRATSVSASAGSSMSASGRRSRRVSGSPTMTRSMKAREAAKEESVLPALPDEVILDIDEATRPALDRLQLHVNDLRNLLIKGIANKENERVNGGSVGSLSRSPKTKNVFLKSTIGSPPLSLSKSNELKNLDLSTLMRWHEGADRLIKECSTATAISPSTSESGAMEELRLSNEDLTIKYQGALSDVTALRTKNAMLKTAYEEMAASTRDLYVRYDGELDGVFLAARHPMTTESAAALLSQTQDALLARNEAMKELDELKRERRLAGIELV